MPSPPRQSASFRLVATAIRIVLFLFVRHRWTGRENVPRTGGVIIAANHLSHLDPLTVAHFVFKAGRLPRFLAKAELFRVPLFGRIVRGAGQIPVYRGTSDAQAALSHAVTALQRGECVIVYPEGTITRDPDLWPAPAKTGVARLALASGAPVVPVAHWGEQRILAPYGKRLRLLPRKLVLVSAGPPVDLTAFAAEATDADALRAATTRVMGAITDLLSGLRDETPPHPPALDRSA